MKAVFPDHKDCYCAYCKSPRRVYAKKHITATNVLLAFVLSSVIMLATWKRLDPRVLFVFVVSLCLAEIFIQIRWRMSMSCRHCGFDPVLYMRDQKAAAQKVRDFFEKRSNDIDFYFTDSPLLKKAQRYRLKSKQDQLGLESIERNLAQNESVAGGTQFQLQDQEQSVDQID